MKRLFYFTASIFLFASTAFASPGSIRIIEKLGAFSQSEIKALATQYPPEVPRAEPKNGVVLYKLTYETKNLHSDPVVASGLLMVPDSNASPSPLLSYQHWTETDRAEVPSTFRRGDSFNLALFYGAQGYIVSAADYLGLGDSPGHHPYLHADSEAWAAADMLRAARSALKKFAISTNGQLFLAGYSQGGHVTMALHRHLERDLSDEFKVTASSPMAGPYDLSGSVQEVITTPSSNSSAEILYLLQTMHQVYGGIYSSIDEVIVSPTPATVLSLYDGLHAFYDIVKALPQTPKDLLKPGFLSDLLSNARNPLIEDLKLNNLYDWKPVAPIRLFHGKADHEVPYHNSETARDRMNALGGHVELISLGDQTDHSAGALPGLYQAEQWFESLRTH